MTPADQLLFLWIQVFSTTQQLLITKKREKQFLTVIFFFTQRIFKKTLKKIQNPQNLDFKFEGQDQV